MDRLTLSEAAAWWKRPIIHADWLPTGQTFTEYIAARSRQGGTRGRPDDDMSELTVAYVRVPNIGRQSDLNYAVVQGAIVFVGQQLAKDELSELRHELRRAEQSRTIRRMAMGEREFYVKLESAKPEWQHLSFWWMDTENNLLWSMRISPSLYSQEIAKSILDALVYVDT